MGQPLPAAKHPLSYLLTPSPQWVGEGTGWAKVDWDKGVYRWRKESGVGSNWCKCSLPPTTEWCPGSLWALTTIEDASLFSSTWFFPEHDIIWYGISLWVIWVSSPSGFPSQLLVHLQLNSCGMEWGRVGERNDLEAVQALCSNSQKLCYQYCFSHKSRMQQ